MSSLTHPVSTSPSPLERVIGQALAIALDRGTPLGERLGAAKVAAAAVPQRWRVPAFSASERIVTDLIVAATAVTGEIAIARVLTEAALRGSRPVTQLTRGLVRLAHAAKARGHRGTHYYVVVRMSELLLDLDIDPAWVEDVLADPRARQLDESVLDRIHARQPSPRGWLRLAWAARSHPDFEPLANDRATLEEAIGRADPASAVILARWLTRSCEASVPR